MERNGDDDMKIGAQFYTVRDYCKELDGFAETLKKVAEIGYRYVQISGTCPYEAEWLKNELDRNGLQCVLTHIPADSLKNETDSVIRNHDVFGCRYVGLGFYSFGDHLEKFDEFCEQFHPVARRLKDGGKYFMYHNHDQEFKKVGNQTLLQKLAEEFSAEEMGFTLDTFWVQAGGADPAQYLELLAGRIPCIHLKDYAYGRKMAVIGEGNINFDRVFEKAEAGGTEYMLVEQDDCGGKDPFECLKRSYENLNSFGFR